MIRLTLETIPSGLPSESLLLAGVRNASGEVGDQVIHILAVRYNLEKFMLVFELVLLIRRETSSILVEFMWRIVHYASDSIASDSGGVFDLLISTDR